MLGDACTVARARVSRGVLFQALQRAVLRDAAASAHNGQRVIECQRTRSVDAQRGRGVGVTRFGVMGTDVSRTSDDAHEVVTAPPTFFSSDRARARRLFFRSFFFAVVLTGTCRHKGAVVHR